MSSSEPPTDPFAILDVDPAATTEEISAAYYEGIRQHPPDRDPEGFKRIRAAYEVLKDEESRARLRLFGPEPLESLGDLLDLVPAGRKFAGPRPWLEVLKQVRG
jgi:DnaJ-class molecular chaperone